MFLINKMESGNIISKGKEKIKGLKSKNHYENLKNDYFLQKVFNLLERKKLFNIIKYNKSLKKRINININDYKTLCSIEIEIKPINNKSGKFINVKKGNEIYHHIYFNNNK